MDTPSHRVQMPDPVEAITTYTETPAEPDKPSKKQAEPKKEDSTL